MSVLLTQYPARMEALQPLAAAPTPTGWLGTRAEPPRQTARASAALAVTAFFVPVIAAPTVAPQPPAETTRPVWRVPARPAGLTVTDARLLTQPEAVSVERFAFPLALPVRAVSGRLPGLAGVVRVEPAAPAVVYGPWQEQERPTRTPPRIAATLPPFVRVEPAPVTIYGPWSEQSRPTAAPPVRVPGLPSFVSVAATPAAVYGPWQELARPAASVSWRPVVSLPLVTPLPAESITPDRWLPSLDRRLLPAPGFGAHLREPVAEGWTALPVAAQVFYRIKSRRAEGVSSRRAEGTLERRAETVTDRREE